MRLGFRSSAAAACFSAAAFLGGSPSQESSGPLPTVVAAAMPTYPRIAELANITGTARLRVYTDGEKVQLSVVLQATPVFGGVAVIAQASSILVTAAQESLETWRFAPHAPTSFEVTFRFNRVITKVREACVPERNDPWNGPDAVSTIRFPTEIEIEGVVERTSFCDNNSQTVFGGTVSEIRGVVVCDCEGRRPIADAEVIVGDDTGNPTDALHRARTDADGRFSVRATRWGTNHLMVQKRGYFDSRHYLVKVVPLPWNRPGNFELEIAPDPAVDKQPPRTRAFLIPTTTPFYPAGAREENVEGAVSFRIAPDGDVTPLAGPPMLLEPTLATVRTWKPKAGDDAAELRFHYKLIDGDCLGGGPTVTLRGSHLVEVVARRIVPCGPVRD